MPRSGGRAIFQCVVASIRLQALRMTSVKQEKDMHSPGFSCIFNGNLIELLPKKYKDKVICFPLKRRAAIKDVIESLSIPHTEIGRIERDGKQLDFHHIPAEGERFNIFPFGPRTPILRPTILRPDPLSCISFMADDTVSKLRRDMRMTGLDTAAAPVGHLKEIAASAKRQQRILVSRNRDLLKCRDVVFGQLIKAEDHAIQLRELLCRYTFKERPSPFSRCLECNSVLEVVKKEDILEQLQPLTRKYYSAFKKCSGCARIYWHGSHLEKMRKFLDSTLPPE